MEQSVDINDFAHLPLAADRVKRQQQQGFEQTFRRHARSALRAITRRDIAPRLRPTRRLTSRKGVVGSDAVFDRERIKQRRLLIRTTTHGNSPRLRCGKSSATPNRFQRDVFSSLLERVPNSSSARWASQVCVAYVEQSLVPTLKRSDTTMMGNLSSHMQVAARTVTEDDGAELKFPP